MPLARDKWCSHEPRRDACVHCVDVNIVSSRSTKAAFDYPLDKLRRRKCVHLPVIVAAPDAVAAVVAPPAVATAPFKVAVGVWQPSHLLGLGRRGDRLFRGWRHDVAGRDESGGSEEEDGRLHEVLVDN